jgi:hypothetical protein
VWTVKRLLIKTCAFVSMDSQHQMNIEVMHSFCQSAFFDDFDRCRLCQSPKFCEVSYQRLMRLRSVWTVKRLLIKTCAFVSMEKNSRREHVRNSQHQMNIEVMHSFCQSAFFDDFDRCRLCQLVDEGAV